MDKLQFPTRTIVARNLPMFVTSSTRDLSHCETGAKHNEESACFVPDSTADFPVIKTLDD